MSTHWGYRCASHNPPLDSEHWLNNGDGELAEAYRLVRAGQWPELPIVWPPGSEHTIGTEPAPVVLSWMNRGDAYSSQTQAPIYWLREHPHCLVQLVNEYGAVRALGPSS